MEEVEAGLSESGAKGRAVVPPCGGDGEGGAGGRVPPAMLLLCSTGWLSTLWLLLSAVGGGHGNWRHEGHMNDSPSVR